MALEWDNIALYFWGLLHLMCWNGQNKLFQWAEKIQTQKSSSTEAHHIVQIRHDLFQLRLEKKKQKKNTKNRTGLFE